ncbi:MAG: hypothetical protein ACYCV7_13500 [Acidimicrobiales bacterium]
MAAAVTARFNSWGTWGFRHRSGGAATEEDWGTAHWYSAVTL